MSDALEVLAFGKKRTKVVATINNEDALLSKQEIEVIEKELKEKEELQKLLDHERDLNNHLITHEGKALEVIFKNGLNVPHQDLIKSSKDYNEYKEEFTEILRSHIEPFKYEIMYSEEEFELLKEVLNNGL